MAKSLIPKLEAIKQRYNEVADLIIQPDVISDQKKYGQLNKEYSDLGKIVKVYDEYKSALDTIEESDEIIADGSDKDLVDLAKMEKLEAQEKIPAFEEDLKAKEEKEKAVERITEPVLAEGVNDEDFMKAPVKVMMPEKTEAKKKPAQAAGAVFSIIFALGFNILLFIYIPPVIRNF